MSKVLSCALCALIVGFGAFPSAFADQPGRGLTGPFEIEFLKFTIDHHFGALRMTELAAGTDRVRNESISPDEGTAPTPGFEATHPKASLNDLKSLARRNNRMQREEILMLQGFLRDWYNIQYTPRLRSENRVLIQILDKAKPGDDFNHAFFETFSRHHFTLMDPVNKCITGSELQHFDLRQACTQMWHSQTADINEMRHELERHYHIVDYQPFNSKEPLGESGLPRGQHASPEPR